MPVWHCKSQRSCRTRKRTKMRQQTNKNYKAKLWQLQFQLQRVAKFCESNVPELYKGGESFTRSLIENGIEKNGIVDTKQYYFAG